MKAIKCYRAKTVVNLTNHHPLVTKLGPGAMRVKADKSEEILFVSGGYLEVNNNKATILADIAENIEAIELEKQEMRDRKPGNAKTRQGDVDQAKLEEELRVAMMREGC